ncbi:quinone oxidoreductase family protein [Variovorax sp. RA8]|uniref:quinone oxidoreductase family protein n=1 Tax=Variovorax sp. (strain JCM 16519 / RA8) TaxID=662548 RepID=UPI0013186ED2|nr:zinc-binding alcohol dehydrogenase family protein [Variovorax sp. RA8]VTU36696.1 Beta-ketoacyl-acyl-carrier-protein synthase I [Variovorax sp. RA8]
MKAVRIPAFDAGPVLGQEADPQPRAGRTIVRMAAATVGHIDRTVWSGAFLKHPPLPYIPGVEAAGTVVASGSYPAGQRVWLRGSGLGTTENGTWCELIDAPDEALGLLPDGLDMALGAAFFSPCTSAWVALHEVAKLQRGERVLVTGASGAVGSMTVQLAREAGAIVLTRAEEAAQQQQPVELLVDTVGGPVLEAALPCVAPGGRAVLVGYTAGNMLPLNIAHFLQRDVALLPLNMFRREAAGRAAVPQLLARLADGRLTLQVQRFALGEAAAALEWITQRGHRGRAVLVP